MAEPFTLQFYVSLQEDGVLLREYLAQKNISKTALTDIKYHGGKILVNSKEETVRYTVRSGDQVVIQFPPEQSSARMKSSAIPLDIIYEDDFILIVNKPAGMSTIPSHEHPSHTLANAIVYHYAQSDHNSAVHFVTRLDYDTSGLVLVAKHRHIHHLFSLAQQKQTIDKEYLAFIEGTIEPTTGEINRPIARIDHSIIKREVRPDGQAARTRYTTKQVFQIGDKQYSMLQLQLLTGRTHQIRVHLQSLGHPLLGDRLYGGECIHIKRQALHCVKLQFAHPITGEKLCFECLLPKDMQFLCNYTS